MFLFQLSTNITETTIIHFVADFGCAASEFLSFRTIRSGFRAGGLRANKVWRQINYFLICCSLNVKFVADSKEMYFIPKHPTLCTRDRR